MGQTVYVDHLLSSLAKTVQGGGDEGKRKVGREYEPRGDMRGVFGCVPLLFFFYFT
jgi:hypothetical protein